MTSYFDALDKAICRHCGRNIFTEDGGLWVDPEATGDDAVWFDYCDSNNTERAAPHEPI